MTEEKENTDIEARIDEWAELTCNDYMDVVLEFMFSSQEDRRFMMRLLKRAGGDFKKTLVIQKNDNERSQPLYDIYSNDYQVYDCWVRYGDELDQEWAMWVKMNALGMTYEEILQDSERRDNYTPLNEKRKGKW
jgi:cytidylate kinase